MKSDDAMPRTGHPVIRSATDSDGPAMAALIAACFSEYENCLFDMIEFPELHAPATHFAGKKGHLWIAVAGDGTVVGSIAATPVAADRAVELTKMYVAKAWRGDGLAQALHGRVLAFALETGAAGIMLWSDVLFTRAHAFYEKLGYVRQDETRFLGDISNTQEYHFRLTLVPRDAAS